MFLRTKTENKISLIEFVLQFSNFHPFLLYCFQSMGQDFSSGLKPEHAAGHTTMTRAGSDLSLRSGNKSPSLPASPISPRSPIMPRAFHSPTSSPLVGRRSMSPRRGADYGFASAVSNIVDQAHYISEQERLKRFGIGTCCAKCHLFMLYFL